ncbi:MAG: hypothetical protein AAGA55_03750 [Planctomycetota bacterium]
MLEPVSNQLAAQARRASDLSERTRKVRRTDQPGGPERDEDTFDSALQDVQRTEKTRRLADADQEEAREDRQASRLPEPRPIAARDEPLDLQA